MSRTRTTLTVAVLSFAVAAALIGGCSQNAASLPTDGAGLVSVLCAKCHQIARVDAAHKDRNGWASTVTRMQTHGLNVTQTQKQAIIDYLAQRDGGS